jgi:dynein assembly factor 3
MLEAIFKLWRNPDPSVFDFEKCWYCYSTVSILFFLSNAFLKPRDIRLRKYLGERYDAIPNVFDWDFQMKLAEKGVSSMKCFSTE